MEPSKQKLSYYHIYLELIRGYIAKLKYLKRDKDVDVKHRLDQALRACGFKDENPSQIVRLYPKKYKAELVIPTAGFVDPGFRPGTLLDALRTEFGEVIKGDINIVRNFEGVTA